MPPDVECTFVYFEFHHVRACRSMCESGYYSLCVYAITLISYVLCWIKGRREIAWRKMHVVIISTPLCKGGVVLWTWIFFFFFFF